MTTKQSQYHCVLLLNKQADRYQAIFIPSETVQEAKQEGAGRVCESLQTQIVDNSSVCAEGTHGSAVALEDAFLQRLHGRRLGGRKDIKGFSQS